MTTTITITSKGQTTIPVEVRRKLGIDSAGGVLILDFDELSNQAVIKNPRSIEEMSLRLTKKIKPGIKPLENVGEWIQKNRKADQNGYID